jgi:hypothetical protein
MSNKEVENEGVEWIHVAETGSSGVILNKVMTLRVP